MTNIQIDRYLQENRLARIDVEDDELAAIWHKALQALADARLPGLSSDGSFLRAYEAGFLLATLALNAVGFRLRGGAERHHYDTFYLLRHLGLPEIQEFGPRLEAFRQDRNAALYEAEGGPSQARAAELRRTVEGFLQPLRSAVGRLRPTLEPPSGLGA